MRFLSNRLLSRHTAALVLALSLASPVAARPAGSAAGASVVDAAKIHIDNFGRINANYYRGGQPQGHDYADLAALGVKTIINLTSDDADANEQAMAKSAGLTYVQIPMTTRVIPTPAQIAEFLKIVNDPKIAPVYVHCVGGRHRTGVMTAIYRLTSGWTSDQAFKEMKQYKFGADFLHPEFKQFVYTYGAQLASSAASPVVAATQQPGGQK